jgi:hypothetical protein
MSRVRQHLVDSMKNVRTTALRLIRGLIRDPEKDSKSTYFCELLFTLHLDYFIAMYITD